MDDDSDDVDWDDGEWLWSSGEVADDEGRVCRGSAPVWGVWDATDSRGSTRDIV